VVAIRYPEPPRSLRSLAPFPLNKGKGAKFVFLARAFGAGVAGFDAGDLGGDAMPRRGILRDQYVRPAKVERARELRKEMTPAETVLWERLRGQRVGGHRFRRQQVIDGFIADFFCNAARVVVEVDGGVHDLQPEADAQREAVIKARDLLVLRFRNEQVFSSPAVVCAEIEHQCSRRTAASAEGARPKTQTSPPSPCSGGRGQATEGSDGVRGT